MFTQNQVFHPFVKFESGKLDVYSLYAKSNMYDDENYIAGQVI